VPGYAPEPYQTCWGVLTPLAGPIGAPECLGFWFEVDSPCQLAGFRNYSDGRHPSFALFQFWDSTPHLLAQAVRPALEVDRDPGGTGWRNTWLHPRIKLAASTPYLVSAAITEFWADFGTLTSASVTGPHTTVYKAVDAPPGYNGVYDGDTDTSGKFSFTDPPTTPTSGNFYAVDVLLLFPP
jgi:hypothetical protein